MIDKRPFSRELPLRVTATESQRALGLPVRGLQGSDIGLRQNNLTC